MSFEFTDGPDGSTDQAIALDGSCAVTLKCSPVDEPSTVAVWFRVNQYYNPSQGDMGLLRIAGAYITYEPAANTVYLTYEGISVESGIPSTDCSSGWHLLAVNIDTSASDQVEVYVDGELIASEDGAVPSPALAEASIGIDVGGGFVAGDFFDFSQWPDLKEITDLDTYQDAVVADPDSVLPPEEA